MFRRRGRPGLLGTVARTAVVAGTATATAGAVNRHQEQKQAEKQAAADQQAAEQAPPPEPVYQAPPPQPVYQAPPPAAACRPPRRRPRTTWSGRSSNWRACGTPACCPTLSSPRPRANCSASEAGRRILAPGLRRRRDSWPAACAILRASDAVLVGTRVTWSRSALTVPRSSCDRGGRASLDQPTCSAVIRHRPSTPSMRNAKARTRSARRKAALTSATPSAGSQTRTVRTCGSAC